MIGDGPPTYVLVHGGGSTSRFWDRVVPRLDGPSVAVDLPGRRGRPGDLASLTVEDEVEAVLNDIAPTAPAEVVVVAHSSGGLVVPGVVAGLREVGRSPARVVVNAVLVPAEGERGVDCLKAHHREGLERAVAQAAAGGDAVTLPGPPADPESFRTAYGGDPLDDDALAFVVDPERCVADTVHHYFQPVRWSAVRGVPVTYVLNDRDRPVAVSHQEDGIERIRALATLEQVIRLDTGHVPAVTHPELLAAAIAARTGADRPQAGGGSRQVSQ